MLEKKRRKHTRLKDFEYSSGNAYFITICTQDKICHFGSVKNSEMFLNEFGRIANECWNDLPRNITDAVFDQHIIMPNHIHGIIFIGNDDLIKQKTGLMNQTPTKETDKKSDNSEWILMKDSRLTLGKIVRYYKASVTRSLRNSGLINFNWQRNYYDHIIRGEKDYINICEYIFYNAIKWELDSLYSIN